MDYQYWTGKAMEHINNLPEGATFELKKLFQGCEWDSLPVKDRQTFGRHFANEVRDGRVPHVEQFKPEGKGNNQYIKR